MDFLLGLRWYQIAAALAAVAALAWYARKLRRDEGRLKDVETARSMAEERLAGFIARAALVSGDGAAAIVAGNGTIAVLRHRGVRVEARRLLAPLALSTSVEGVRIETGESVLGNVTLFGVLEADVRRIEGIAQAGNVVDLRQFRPH
ncbi:hypothetical protein [Sphingomonas sp. NFR15]|uniref:hypothetical protein n=1 Tax=Sphingomonas sp. NFR15 TaxID=1566282 RepID=UPI00088D184E|nr:hypothetical protein [Sphingomonas sp. NFR15]SDA27267.1 hypothetical protein SAMN03159340_02142 [Sphingomonas sp. NFR15]